MSNLTRTEFLRLVVGAGAGALTVGALAACDDDDGSGRPIDAKGGGDAPQPIDAAIDARPIDAPGPMGNCAMNGTMIVIGGNHGHVLTIPKEDIIAGVEKPYTMVGGDHTHPVTITAAMFATLATNIAVMGRTALPAMDDPSGHDHAITIRCA